MKFNTLISFLKKHKGEKIVLWGVNYRWFLPSMSVRGIKMCKHVQKDAPKPNWNLSDKIMKLDNEFNNSICLDDGREYAGDVQLIFMRDVREFIRRLKEDLLKQTSVGDMIDIIDNLAGEKLK